MQSRQRFLNACAGKPVDRPPVWIMRQAGRTLPEYRAVRKDHSFWEMVTTPELAARVTLQPMRRFPLDAAVIFSDILTVPYAMGMGVSFKPQPVLSPLIRSEEDVDALEIPDVNERLGFVAGAIRAVRAEAGGDFAAIGFSGAPYTLACYMVEGGGSKHFEAVKAMMHSSPRVFDKLLAKVARVASDYLTMQIEAGASAVQLFDTWAGELTPGDFRRFALPHIRTIIERVKPTGAPVIYYINGIGNLLESAREIGADVLGIDWRVELAEVRRRLGADQPVQGNLEPAALLGPAASIRERVHRMLDQTGGRGHIVNLGHGVLPETPIESIETFVNAVHGWAEARA